MAADLLNCAFGGQQLLASLTTPKYLFHHQDGRIKLTNPGGSAKTPMAFFCLSLFIQRESSFIVNRNLSRNSALAEQDAVDYNSA